MDRLCGKCKDFRLNKLEDDTYILGCSSQGISIVTKDPESNQKRLQAHCSKKKIKKMGNRYNEY